MSNTDSATDLSGNNLQAVAAPEEAEITKAILKLSPEHVLSVVRMGIAKHPGFRTHVDAVLLSIAKADERFRNDIFKMAEKDVLPQTID